MRLLVFGGRNYRHILWMREQFQFFQQRHGPITILIHGGAPGADSMADMLAHTDLRCSIWEFPAKWDDVTASGAVIKYNKAGKPYNILAGHWRNQSMLEIAKPQWAMGFAGGSGTADMLGRLDNACIPVWDAGCRA